MKIIFMGTPKFSVSVLKKLYEAGNDIGMVLTQPDKARNRGKVTYSPVKECALELGLPVYQPRRLSAEPELVEKMREYGPDAIVVAAFGQILKEDVLELPRLGCFNAHASLLPKFRGASPMQHAILSGDEYTGVTVMKMEKGLDTGDMISKVEVEIGRKTLPELEDALAEAGAELMVKTLPEIEAGTAVFTPQDDSMSTYAGMINKNDGVIDWSVDAAQIERMVRAYQPWPGVTFMYGDKKVKVWASDAETGESGKEPGTVLSADKSGIRVACGTGVLVIKELQLPGKKRVKVSDFLLGNKVESGVLFS
ncbi:MAG: methionyl-tRNA formyltransferase [Eubacteriales bacterium]|nr:methionyl-tRNA formyltransferase [Eubacteriales bacterium]